VPASLAPGAAPAVPPGPAGGGRRGAAGAVAPGARLGALLGPWLTMLAAAGAWVAPAVRRAGRRRRDR
jgi:hypothetical protein